MGSLCVPGAGAVICPVEYPGLWHNLPWFSLVLDPQPGAGPDTGLGVSSADRQSSSHPGMCSFHHGQTDESRRSGELINLKPIIILRQSHVGVTPALLKLNFLMYYQMNIVIES